MNEISVRNGRGLVEIELSADTLDSLRRSRRDSTRLAYRGDLRRFLESCSARGLIPPEMIPPLEAPLRDVSDDDLRVPFAFVVERVDSMPKLAANYIQELARATKAPSTLDRALSAIAVAYRALTGNRLNTDGARAVLTTYRRDRAEAGGKARKTSPATVKAIRAMVGTLDTATPIGIRDRAILILGFAMGARRSELASLNIEDLTEVEGGFDVLVRTSKTDRESQGRVAVAPYGEDPNTCPVRTVKAWLEVLTAHGRTTGPLFVRIDAHGTLGRVPTGRGSTDGRLTGQAVALVVQRAATTAGIAAGAIWAGHSLRRGFATEARRSGADGVSIGRQGGWMPGSRAMQGYFDEADRWTDNPLKKVGL